MSGAIRYITNKPDLHAFSAGVDLDGGKIQGGQNNQTYEGFVNIPLIDGVLGFRASAFSVDNGGFINNELTTRTWVNGAVSNNAPWARNDYNRENMRRRPRWRSRRSSARAGARCSPTAFSASTPTARGTRTRRCAPRTVERFGPEQNLFETNMVDFHVGRRRRHRRSGVRQHLLEPGAAAVERILAIRAELQRRCPPSAAGFPGTQEGYTCLNDPYYGSWPLHGM